VGFYIAHLSGNPSTQARGRIVSIGSLSGIHRRISTLLLVILTTIAALVLLGLTVMTFQLVEIKDDIAVLRDNALPRLVKLSQLSQEASATISIAPALSAKPTRFEFETLLSRINDKEASQKALIKELEALIRDEHAAKLLRKNGELLMANLQSLTDIVRQQITVRKNLENHIEYFHRLARSFPNEVDQGGYSETDTVSQVVHTTVFKILLTLLDPNSARFPRNKNEIEEVVGRLTQALSRDDLELEGVKNTVSTGYRLNEYWSTEKNQIYADKQIELSNEFKVKALVEENSLIANRLLAGASNEFWRASAELETQIKQVDQITRFTLIAIIIIVVAFGVGNYFVWIVLKRRVFERLDRMGDAVRAFADHRDRSLVDPIEDEIGEISGSLIHYMTLIEKRESELQQLSNQLAKYLSPQVYESIFRGNQEVKVASSRKKLTVFFSDIAGFTEEADRLQSEELTKLLNHYLTEMSQIALNFGATIDKYVGDAILIFFGDPETKGVKEDAIACVKMAIDMRRRMYDLEDIWRESGIERPLQVRMGIHTDYCTVGNFGSEDRMDYTIIGRAVNIASRLESLATPGEILISYETFAQVKNKIHCQEHGEVKIKGISYPVATYQVVESYGQLGRARRHFSENHPSFIIDLDLDAMTSHDRNQAADVLRKALDMLSEEGHPNSLE
jgi:class 3 adenylate cyclase